MKEIDRLLKKALQPADEADFWLNQKILSHEVLQDVKEMDTMKKSRKFSPAAIAGCLLGICLLSATGIAAQKYLTANEVVGKLGDQKLEKEFSKKKTKNALQKQSSHGMDFSFLGIVSGDKISDQLYLSNEDVRTDRSYAVMAIEYSDGRKMPEKVADIQDEDRTFFVSPFIEGYNPAQHNITTMNGGYSEMVEDGILYRLVECDNVEIFAKHKLYLAVQSGTFYDADAYHYDQKSGKITRNGNYEGVNLLFDLPIDESKGDEEAVKAYQEAQKEAMEQEDDEEIPEDAGDKAVKKFMKKLTPENIDQYAKPVESTRQTVKPDKDGCISVKYSVKGRGSGKATTAVEYLFPDGKCGMSPDFGCSYGEDGLDDLIIDTYTLNEDGSVSFVAYIPK